MTDPFETELDELLHRRVAAATPSSDARRRIDEKIKRRTRRQRALAGLGALAVVALLGAGVVWQQGSGADDSSTVEYVDEEGEAPDPPEAQLVEAAVEVSAQLGREEVLTAAVMGEGGDEFLGHLAVQRVATDAAVAAARARLPEGQAAIRLGDLHTLRAAVDAGTVAPLVAIEQYAQTREAVFDEPLIDAADVDDQVLFGQLDAAASFAEGVGFTADASAYVVMILGLPQEQRAQARPSDEPCSVTSDPQCAYDAMLASLRFADDRFESWARSMPADDATVLDTLRADALLDEVVGSIAASAEAPEVLDDPVRDPNDIFVPRALAHLDELWVLFSSFDPFGDQAPAPDPESRTPTSTTTSTSMVSADTTLTAESVTRVAVDLLAELGAIGMESGPLLRLSRVPAGVEPLTDLLERARTEGAPAPLVEALENADRQFTAAIDANSDGYYTARLEELVDVIEAAELLADDAPKALAVAQTARLAEGYASLAYQQALLTTVITSAGGQWFPDWFDRFVAAGAAGDEQLADWENRADADLKTIYRNETTTSAVRTADEIVAAAVFAGPGERVDAAAPEWIGSGTAKLAALARVLEAQVAEIP